MQPVQRILLVDDERFARQLYADYLRVAGHTVETAESAEAAVEALSAGRFDLVITDMVLPGEDGLALLARVKAIDPDCAVIVITALTFVDPAVRAIKSGAADYLVKPVTAEGLQLAVARAMATRDVLREHAQLKRGLALLENCQRLLTARDPTRIPEELANALRGASGALAVAVLAPDELREEQAFYTHTAEGAGSQVVESEAALRLQQRQMTDQIAQAEANLAATESQRAASDAELENARVSYDRAQRMVKDGIGTQEQLDTARTAFEVAKSHIAALAKQIDAQKASVQLARSAAEQVAIRQSQVVSTRQQQAAATAQRAKADVRLAYTELHAPLDGIVDVRAARTGEFLNAGQPVLTIVNPDDLWVRADIEESYIDRVKVGDKLRVRLPSGEEREGTVFFRGVDASFATQRDVSRTKRDIKTFEIRLRLDNTDRRLAVGMTAYVLLPTV
jgi:multidrug resistance efflux pump